MFLSIFRFKPTFRTSSLNNIFNEIRNNFKDSELNNSKIEKELEESKSNIKDLEDKLSQINSIYSELKK